MKNDGVQSHLTPKEAAEAKEDAPQPLLNGQPYAAKRFSTKLHNEDLHEEKKAFDHHKPEESSRLPQCHQPGPRSPGSCDLTCMIKVPSTMEQKIGLLKTPSKTFLSP